MKLTLPFQRAAWAATMMCSAPLAGAAPFAVAQSPAQQPAYGYQPQTAQQQMAAAYGYQPQSPAQHPQAPTQQPQATTQQPPSEPAYAYGYPTTAAQQGSAAAPSYSANPYSAYPQQGYGQQRVAYRGAPTQELPTPSEPVTPAEPQPSYESTPDYSSPAYNYPAASATPATAPAADCNCNAGAATASTSWEGYAAGCASGDVSASVFGGAYGSGCYTGGCGDCGPRRQWFGGVYGLYMTRTRPTGVQTSVLTDGAPADYYPMPTDLYLVSNQADVDYAAGIETRFGSTFGHAGCGCSTYQPYAWEVVYWGLDEDSSFAEVVDTFGGTTRMYGRINYAGIQYDRDGTAGGTYGYRPVNDYYDYQVPVNDSTSTNDVRVLANRVTQRFKAQNVELNFWRFGAPASVGGAVVSSCGSYGAAACGDGSCGTGSCAPACDVTACCSPGQRFFISGLAGVRFTQFDEFFRNAVFFTRDDGAGAVVGGEPGFYSGSMPNDDNVLFHDIQVDNDLVGFQLGCSMNCLVGCKWSLFADTNFGIYGNDADVYQRVYSPGGGDVAYVNGGAAVAARNSKQDVAFLGEARLGFGYQMSCHWRATAAWRVLAASGVAVAADQIPTAGFINSQTVSYIDTNGSLVVHGLQAGVECKY